MSKSLAAYFVYAKLGDKVINPGIEGIQEIRVIGIFERNCSEWIICDIASMLLGISSVTLYDTLGADSSEQIIKESELETICCSANKLSELILLKK